MIARKRMKTDYADKTFARQNESVKLLPKGEMKESQLECSCVCVSNTTFATL